MALCMGILLAARSHGLLTMAHGDRASGQNTGSSPSCVLWTDTDFSLLTPDFSAATALRGRQEMTPVPFPRQSDRAVSQYRRSGSRPAIKSSNQAIILMRSDRGADRDSSALSRNARRSGATRFQFSCGAGRTAVGLTNDQRWLATGRGVRFQSHHWAQTPPSTGSVCPVTYRASSESSQTTGSAMSSGWPIRPIGTKAA